MYGILLPALMLLKPQVEGHLSKECLRMTAGNNSELAKLMEKPCQAIAAPIADCLIKESERTNNVLKVISEVISKKYGEGSETVTKACLAKTLGIPAESLKDVPLARLIDQMQQDSNDETKACQNQPKPKKGEDNIPIPSKPRR
jgi:hypothetical protein